MEASKMRNYIKHVLKNMPSDWLELTTHRLDIYNEELAKTQFLEQFQNLYEPNFEYTRVNYDVKNRTLYIQSLNSDGAGGYAVIWIIENGVFKKKVISRGF